MSHEAKSQHRLIELRTRPPSGPEWARLSVRWTLAPAGGWGGLSPRSLLGPVLHIPRSSFPRLCSQPVSWRFTNGFSSLSRRTVHLRWLPHLTSTVIRESLHNPHPDSVGRCHAFIKRKNPSRCFGFQPFSSSSKY